MFLGFIGIQDKIVENVEGKINLIFPFQLTYLVGTNFPETVATFKKANINIAMLTGKYYQKEKYYIIDVYIIR